MRWFRTNLRFGACLALCALTIQLALSFAHVHFDVAGQRGAASKVITLLALQPASDAVAPAKPDPNKAAVDFCAICTLIQMAGASPPAASPQVPLPARAGRALHGISVVLALETTPHALFQARAPPLA